MEIKPVVKRKKRSDRMHAIYRLVNTQTGESYIGLTVCAGVSPKKAVEGRFQRHVTRALTQGKEWTLCKAIREFGAAAFKVEVMTTVRGKAEAHVKERELTREIGATLNTA
jgi:hypothetical protein